MSTKALYRHKTTGDLFAIETDETGKVISTDGLSLSANRSSPWRETRSIAEGLNDEPLAGSGPRTNPLCETFETS